MPGFSRKSKIQVYEKYPIGLMWELAALVFLAGFYSGVMPSLVADAVIHLFSSDLWEVSVVFCLMVKEKNDTVSFKILVGFLDRG